MTLDGENKPNDLVPTDLASIPPMDSAMYCGSQIVNLREFTSILIQLRAKSPILADDGIIKVEPSSTEPSPSTWDELKMSLLTQRDNSIRLITGEESPEDRNYLDIRKRIISNLYSGVLNPGEFLPNLLTAQQISPNGNFILNLDNVRLSTTPEPDSTNKFIATPNLIAEFGGYDIENSYVSIPNNYLEIILEASLNSIIAFGVDVEGLIKTIEGYSQWCENNNSTHTSADMALKILKGIDEVKRAESKAKSQTNLERYLEEKRLPNRGKYTVSEILEKAPTDLLDLETGQANGLPLDANTIERINSDIDAFDESEHSYKEIGDIFFQMLNLCNNDTLATDSRGNNYYKVSINENNFRIYLEDLITAGLRENQSIFGDGAMGTKKVIIQREMPDGEPSNLILRATTLDLWYISNYCYFDTVDYESAFRRGISQSTLKPSYILDLLFASNNDLQKGSEPNSPSFR